MENVGTCLMSFCIGSPMLTLYFKIFRFLDLDVSIMLWEYIFFLVSSNRNYVQYSKKNNKMTNTLARL